MAYQQIIDGISILPDNILDVNIFLNILKPSIKNSSESTVSPNIEDEQEKELLLEPKISSKSKSLVQLTSNNYTIIEPPKLFTGRLNRPIYTMKGGSIESKKEIQKLLLNSNDNILADIMKTYYEDESEILDGNDIINILVSIVYDQFIESKLEFSELSSLKHIESIPEMYIFNFKDKVMIDLEKNIPNYQTKINVLNVNVKNLKKILSNDMLEIPILKSSNLKAETASFGPKAETSSFGQAGGKTHKRVETSNDKTVEEKINKNIEVVSTYLKSNSIKKQRGGKITSSVMLADIMAYNNLPAPKPESETRAIKEKANIWVVELLEQKLASKEIRDDQHNIARFYIRVPTPSTVDPRVISFINDNASMLTLDNRIKINMPNEIKVASLGNAKRGYITDQLQEYFNKKYQKLLELQNSNYDDLKKQPEPLDEVGKIKLVLAQYGGVNPDDLEEKCFTSKQYTLFLRKMTMYFKSIQKNMDAGTIDQINQDIETLKRIESDLMKNNTLFNNYKKIQEVYPDKLARNITVEHLQEIQNTNSQIIDKYGKVNTNIINTIKAVEKYTELKEIHDEAKKYPNLEKEMDRLNFTQAGGGAMNSTLKFNNNHDVEYFVSRSFEKILKEMKDEDKDKNN